MTYMYFAVLYVPKNYRGGEDCGLRLLRSNISVIEKKIQNKAFEVISLTRAGFAIFHEEHGPSQSRAIRVCIDLRIHRQPCRDA